MAKRESTVIKQGANMLKRLRRRILIEIRRITGWYAKAEMMRRRALWAALQEYLAKTKSTGCNMTDYWFLYRAIRRLKPIEVLECGTGVSTLVIAHALMENELETKQRGRITSMEEISEWIEMAQQILPAQYKPYVDFCLSGTCEDYFSVFRGVRYESLPNRPYDFIFIDGPKYVSPKDGQPTCDFDFIHILRKTTNPIAGLVDKRVSTCFMLQQLIGSKITYNPVLHLGIIKPTTRADLGSLEKELSSTNFEDSFRVLSPTILKMKSKV
ncbi:MAG: class I SAM-dependent methyltransferase [Alphaproteobacteria bacterium]|nr:class I SAM-dependent methyltransferase [Alphaproteobacteria bacterium]